MATPLRYNSINLIGRTESKAEHGLDSGKNLYPASRHRKGLKGCLSASPWLQRPATALTTRKRDDTPTSTLWGCVPFPVRCLETSQFLESQPSLWREIYNKTLVKSIRQFCENGFRRFESRFAKGKSPDSRAFSILPIRVCGTSVRNKPAAAPARAGSSAPKRSPSVPSGRDAAKDYEFSPQASIVFFNRLLAFGGHAVP